jgi:dolichol-phosphate mannosyltransferase
MILIDILMPVYEEGERVWPVLDSLLEKVRTPFRVLICYDDEGDSTLGALERYERRDELDMVLVKNRGQGAYEAIETGFQFSNTDAVVVLPADDTHNAGILDEMIAHFEAGAALVCASRFMKGGRMKGCRWQKALLVRTASLSLYYLGRLSSHDASNGFRLFSRRVLDGIEIETKKGFAFSLELLVKCHRLGWSVAEVPAKGIERNEEKSRFQIIKWLPIYLRWYFYGLATTFFRLGSDKSAGQKNTRLSAPPVWQVAAGDILWYNAFWNHRIRRIILHLKKVMFCRRPSILKYCRSSGIVAISAARAVAAFWWDCARVKPRL